MSKRKPNQSPLSKGAALIIAREILGPDARVYALYDPSEHYIDRGPNTVAVVGPAPSWEDALHLAEKEPQAYAWQNYKDGRKNAFLEAVASLRNTIRKILGSKDAKHLTRREHRFVRGALGRLA